MLVKWRGCASALVAQPTLPHSVVTHGVDLPLLIDGYEMVLAGLRWYSRNVRLSV